MRIVPAPWHFSHLPPFDVEGKAAALVALCLGLGKLGKKRADGPEEVDVRGRVGAWRASDGALVDVDDLVDLLHALHRFIAAFRQPGCADPVGKDRIEEVGKEAGLPRTGNPRDRNKRPQGKGDGDVLQVVLRGASENDFLPASLPALPGPFHDERAREVLPVRDCGEAQTSATVPAATTWPAVDARPGPEVHDVVRRAQGLLVVLHDDERVADVAQVLQRFDEERVVALVQPDGGLIEDVQHAHQ